MFPNNGWQLDHVQDTIAPGRVRSSGKSPTHPGKQAIRFEQVRFYRAPIFQHGACSVPIWHLKADSF